MLGKMSLMVIALFFAGLVSAQTTYTWTGTSGSSFTTTTNWTPNGTPGINDSIIINSTTSIALTANTTVRGINVNGNSVALTFTGAYTIADTNLNLNGTSAQIIYNITSTTSPNVIIGKSITYGGAGDSIVYLAQSNSYNFQLGDGTNTFNIYNPTNGAFGFGTYSVASTAKIVANYAATSNPTIYFNATTPTIWGLGITKGNLTIGSSVKVAIMTMSTTNAQNLIVPTGVTLNLGGNNTSTYAASGALIDATNGNIIISGQSATLLNNGLPMFKNASVYSLNLNTSSGFAFNPYQALTITNLTLTSGIYNNTVNNVTIASSGSVTIAGANGIMSAAPIYATGTPVTISTAASTTAGNELQPTSGSVGALTFSPTATATYTLNGSGVKSLSISSAGYSSTYTPKVTFSAPTSGTTATGTAYPSPVNGSLSIAITNSGTGYTAAPTIYVTPSNIANVATWAVSTTYLANTIVKNGSNYYVTTATGISASSGGGPTGTTLGSANTDNTITWYYIGNYAANTLYSSTSSYVFKNNLVYKLNTAGTTANPTTPTGTTTFTDGGVTWTYVSGIGSPAAWVKGTVYSANTIVSNGGNYYICTTAGTAAGTGSGPTATVLSSTISDNSVKWNYIGSWYAGTSYSATSYILSGTNVYKTTAAGITAGGLSGNTTGITDGTAKWDYFTAFSNTWSASTPYYVGQVVSNSSNLYLCTTAGYSASSGGPTGSTTASDGANIPVTWTYLSAGPASSTVTATIPTTNSISVASISISGGSGTITPTLSYPNSTNVLTVNVSGTITLGAYSAFTAGTQTSNVTHLLKVGGNITGAASTTYPTFNMYTSAGKVVDVTFNGGGAQSVSSNFATLAFNNITTATTNTNVTFGSAPTINGSTTIAANTTLQTGVAYPGSISNSGTLQVNNSGSYSGTITYNSGSTASFNNSSYSIGASDKMWPSGTTLPNVNVLAALAISDATGSSNRTVSGTLAVGGAVTLSSTATNTLTIGASGNLKMNSGGSFSSATNEPIYTAGAMLEYNSGVFATNGNEWNSPSNVKIDAATTFTPTADLSLGGSWTNNGTFAANGHNITFTSGGSAATIAGATTFYNLTVNNSAGLTLSNAVSVTNVLTLTSGIVATTSSNLLSVTNTSDGAITGESGSSFINGPLAWTLPTSSSGNTFTFPVGSGTSYYPLALTSPTTSAAGTIATAQVVLSGSGGSVNASLTGISGTEYWSLAASGTGNITGGDLGLTRTGVSLGSYTLLGSSSSVAGAYASIGSSSTYSGNTISYASTSIPSISNGNSNYYVYAYFTSNPTLSGFTIGGSSTSSGYYGQTLTINGSNFVSGATVSFNGGSSLATTFVNSSQLTVTIPLSATTGNITVTSNSQTTSGVAFTINGYISDGSGDWNSTTADAPWPSGFVPGAGSTVVINSAVTVGATVSGTISSITISGGSLAVNAGGTLTATSITNSATLSTASTGVLNVTTLSNSNSSTISMSSGGSLYIGGNFTNSGTFTGTAGTVYINGGSAQSIPGVSYNNLNIQNTSASVTASGNLTIGGTLTIPSSAVLDMGTYTLGGSLTTSGTGKLRTSSTSSTPITTSQTWFFTVEYYGSNPQTIVNGSYATLNVTTSNSVTFSGTLNIAGDFNYSASSSTITGTTFNFNGSGAQAINAASGFTFNALTISNTGGIVTAGGALTVTTLTLNTNAILDMSTYALVGSSLTISGSGTLRTANTTTTPIPSGKTWSCLVEYTATSGGQTIPTTGTSTTSGLTVFSNGLKCDNTSGVDSVINTTSTSTNGYLTINGKLSVATGGTFAAGTQTIQTTTSFDGSSMFGNFHTNLGGTTAYQFPINTTWGTGSTVSYQAGGNTRVVPGTYYNLIPDAGGSASINLDYVANSTATFTINGNITLDYSTSTMSTPRFTTVVFNGSSQNIPAWSFYNLTVTSSSVFPTGTVTIEGTFTPNGLTSASQGTISFNPIPAFADLNLTIPSFTYNNLTFTGSVNGISNQTGSLYNGSVAIILSNASDMANLPTGAGITGTGIPSSTTISGSNSSAAYTPLSNPYYIVYNSIYYFSYDTLIHNSIYDFGKTGANMAVLTSGVYAGIYVKSHFGNQTASATNLYTSTNGTSTITVTKNSSTSGLNPGMIATVNPSDASGISIPTATYIQSVGSATSIGGGFYTFTVTLSAAVTGTASGALVDFGAVNVLSGAISGYTSGTQVSTSTFSPAIVLTNAVSNGGGLTTPSNISTSNVNITISSGINVNGIFTDSHTGSYNSVTSTGAVTLANGAFITAGSSTTIQAKVAVAASGSATSLSNLTVGNTLTIPTGATLSMSKYQLFAGTGFSTSISGVLDTRSVTTPAIPKGYTWGGTVRYDTTASQTIIGGSYTNLDVSGGGARTLINANTASGTDSIIYISGTYTPSTSTTTIGTSKVVFNGTGNQSIASGASFYNLQIDNTGGLSNAITLNGAVTVGTTTSGTLTLTAGRVLTTGTNTLTLVDTIPTALSGGSSASYVDGPLTRGIRAASIGYAFPLGNYNTSSLFIPDTINASSAAGNITITAFKGNSGGSYDGTLTGISTNEYWSIQSSVSNTLSLTTTPSSISGFSVNGESSSSNGTYSSIGGVATSTSITSNISLAATTTEYIVAASYPDASITSVTSCISGLSSGSFYTRDTLTLVGNYFQATSTVFVGGQAATIVDATGIPTQLRVVVSSTATTGAVQVGTTTYAGSTTLLPGYVTVANGSWNTGVTWLGGIQPSGLGIIATINNAVTLTSSINGSSSLSSLTINSGASFAAGNIGITYTSATSPYPAASILNNGTFTGSSSYTFNGTITNNGTMTFSGGTFTFNGNTTINGSSSASLYSLNTSNSGMLTFTTSPSIAGNFYLNAGWTVVGNYPIYGGVSTLFYNTGTSVTPGKEWAPNVSSGAGIPNAVQVGNGAANSSISFASGNTYKTGYTFEVNSGYSVTIPNTVTLTPNNLKVMGIMNINNGAQVQSAGSVIIGSAGTINVGSSALSSPAINGTDASLVITGSSSFSDTGTVNNYGYIKLSTTSSNYNFLLLGSGALNMKAYSVIELDNADAAVPTSTWDANSYLYLTGILGGNPTNIGQSFGNVVWNCTSQTGNLSVTGLNNVGNFIVLNTGTGAVRLNNATNTYGTLQVGGSATVNGTLVNSTAASLNLGYTTAGATQVNGNVTVGTHGTIAAGAAGTSLALTGSLNVTGTFTGSNLTVDFDGTSTQSVPVVSYGGLTINNSAGVTLAGNISASGLLTLINGMIPLGSNNLTVGSITGGNSTSYIDASGTGRLIAGIASSATETLPIGTSTSYAPLTIANQSSSSSNLTIGIGSTITNAVGDPTQVANLQWSVIGSTAINANITFQFNSVDLPSGFITTNSCEVGDYKTSYVATQCTGSGIPSGSNPYTVTANGFSIPTSGTNYFVVGNTGNVVVTATSWTGAFNTSWSNPLNWTNNVPTSSVDVVIQSGGYSPTLATTSTFNNLTVNSGAVLTLGSSATLLPNKNINNNGTIAGAGTLTLAGSAAQTVSGTGIVGNLTVNNSHGVTVSSGSNSLGISGVLTLQSGVFTTNGNVTLKSLSIANSGVLAPYGVSGNTGTISGNVTVERYIPAGYRGYRDLAPQVYNSSNTMFNSWQENGSFTHNGYGIFITGPTSTDATLADYASGQIAANSATGLDYSLNGISSAYTYGNGTWPAITNTKTTTLDPLSGYRVLVRGDRSFNLATTPILIYPAGLRMYNATTLRATGSLVTGTVTYSTTGVTGTANGSAITSTNALNANATVISNGKITQGLSMVANPYACPVSWTSVYNNSVSAGSNINGTWYFLDPTYGATGTYEGYNYAAGSQFSDETNASDLIQAGQAFFVLNAETSPTPKVVFEESAKQATSTKLSIFGAAAPLSKIYIGIYKETNGSYTRTDGAAVAFRSDFTDKSFGTQDALKVGYGSDYIAISDKGVNLGIDGRLPATASDAVALKIGSPTATSYQLQVDASRYINEGFAPLLYDAYKNTTTALGSAVTTVNFTVDASTAASYENRFTIIFTPSALAVNSIVASATLNDKIATITWNTVGEKGESYFEVEKSTDGKNFTAIGQQAAKNTATASYTATDNSVVEGNNYYRIKAVSETGSIAYSNVAKVQLTVNSNQFTVYPNPLVGKTLNVSLSNVNAGKYIVSIYNVLGEKVVEQAIVHEGGSATHAITINNTLARGVYSVTIREALSNQIVHQASISVQP